MQNLVTDALVRGYFFEFSIRRKLIKGFLEFRLHSKLSLTRRRLPEAEKDSFIKTFSVGDFGVRLKTGNL